MTARVYSYIRFSDARQAAGASFERQRDYAQRWAKDHGLELDQALSLRDEGLSAYHQRHVTKGALGVFLKAVEDDQVPRGSVLVVEGLDRLSRAEPIQALAQLTSIITAGVTVVTAVDGKAYNREGIKANPMDLMQALLVMIRANEESETKSKRVRDAIRRQCQGWQAGTYRGLVRLGQSPSWLHVVDGKWQLIPDRAAALRLAIELYRQGQGTAAIARRLAVDGLAISDAPATSGHLQRLFAHPALAGDKHVNLGPGDEYELADYYPALLGRAEWAELQQLLASRARAHVRSDVPSILTGMGITRCGYCGAPLKAQTMTRARRADGSIPDGHRRLQCASNNGGGCAVPGSSSAAPIERALVHYCSDMVNLRALYQGDRATVPRAELAAAEVRLAKVDRQLERITHALLASDNAPTTFVRRARELELERDQAQRQVQAAGQALQNALQADLSGLDVQWRSLAAGVDALHYESRMRARQLVADTFERIVVYRRGVRPDDNVDQAIDVMLLAKGGTARLLRVDKRGGWVAAEDLASAAV